MDKIDGYTIKIIGQDNRPDDMYDPEELKAGIEVEKEHTDQEELAKSIAKDHLDELPDYYTRLKKMEDESQLEIESLIEKFLYKDEIDN